VMLDGDNNEYPAAGTFKEIVEQEKIVATDEFGDSDKNEQAAPEGLPTGMVNTTSFEEAGDQTKITIPIMHQSVEERKKHEEKGAVEDCNQQHRKPAEDVS